MSSEMKWKTLRDFKANALRKPIAGRFDVYLASTDLHVIVVLAEISSNPGPSVTNAFEAYSRAVCRSEGIDSEKAVFYELYAFPGRQGDAALRFSLGDNDYGATFDRVEVDFVDEDTEWFPGDHDSGKAIFESLAGACQIRMSYDRPG